MNYLEIDYWVNRDEETLIEGYVQYDLSDRKLKAIIEFIKDDHYTGELIDIPSDIYESIMEALYKTAKKDLRDELKTKLLDTDELMIQTCLPVSLLALLPTEVIEKIDKTGIFEYYEVDSMDDLIEEITLDEDNTIETFEPIEFGATYMKCLAFQQPFASLIAYGIQDVECRNAMIPPIGKILIAASGTRRKWNDIPTHLQKIIRKYQEAGIFPKLEDLPTKCIVGSVDITGTSEGLVASPWGNYCDGIKYHLANARVFDEPILGKNKATPVFYNVEGYDENNLPVSHTVNLKGVKIENVSVEPIVEVEKTDVPKNFEMAMEGTFNVGRNLAIDGMFLKGGILVGDKVVLSNGQIVIEDTVKKLLYNVKNLKAAVYSEPSDRITLLLTHVKEKDLPGKICDYTIRKI